MRPLTEEVQTDSQILGSRCVVCCSSAPPPHMPRLLQETRVVLEKLFKFVGKGIKNIVEPKDELHCFRLHNDRIFYVREDLMRRATNVSAEGMYWLQPPAQSCPSAQLPLFLVLALCQCSHLTWFCTDWQGSLGVPWTADRQAHAFWQVQPYCWSS